jgi:hypothetical protein
MNDEVRTLNDEPGAKVSPELSPSCLSVQPSAFIIHHFEGACQKSEVAGRAGAVRGSIAGNPAGLFETV